MSWRKESSIPFTFFPSSSSICLFTYGIFFTHLKKVLLVLTCKPCKHNSNYLDHTNCCSETFWSNSFLPFSCNRITLKFMEFFLHIISYSQYWKNYQTDLTCHTYQRSQAVLWLVSDCQLLPYHLNNMIHSWLQLTAHISLYPPFVHLKTLSILHVFKGLYTFPHHVWIHMVV